MISPKNILVDRRFLTVAVCAVLGLLISGLIFVPLLTSFNTGKQIEQAIEAKEKAAADARCEEYNDFLITQHREMSDQVSAFKATTGELVRSLRVEIDTQRRQVGYYYSSLISAKRTIKDQEKLIKGFENMETYQDVWNMYHEVIPDMPEIRKVEAQQ